MKYIYVNNGIIDKTQTRLPKTWNNISNFDFLSNEELLKFGWYPLLIMDSSTIPSDEIVLGWEYVLFESHVEYKPITRKKTANELLISSNIEIQKQWSTIRRKRNTLLQDSDWTQMQDAPITDENKQEWAIYRQKLRDLTLARTPDRVIYPIRPIFVKKQLDTEEFAGIGDATTSTPPPINTIDYYDGTVDSDFHYKFEKSYQDSYYVYFIWKQVDRWDNQIPSLEIRGYDIDTKELIFTVESDNQFTAELMQSTNNETWIPYDVPLNQVGSYIMLKIDIQEQIPLNCITLLLAKD